MFERLARALAARDLPVARRLLVAAAQQRGTKEPNVRMMASVLARLEGRLDESLAQLISLRRALPRQAAVAYQLALTLIALERRDEAIAEFRAALSIDASHADAAFNLGLLLRGHDDAAAGHAFFHAARHQPALMEAAQQALNAAARLSATKDETPALPAVAADDGRDLVSFVVCSIEPDRLARLRENLASLFGDSAWELVHIPDATSLCEGYNRGGAQARGEWLVFCHDDVRFLAPDFRARLLAHLGAHDVIGVAGTTRCTGPAAFWTGIPEVHGWVTYPEADGSLIATYSGTRGPVVEGAQALDGQFLAMRREWFDRVRFDDATFDGFHLYDLDFSYRAFRAGARVAICQDLLPEHSSHGGFDARWREYADRFLAKFPELANHPATTQPASFRVSVPDADAARRIYAWLGHWAAALDAGRLP